MRRDRGFALLVVLWSLVLIGLVMTRIVAAGRSSVTLAANLRAAAAAQALADGAIEDALFHVLARGGAHWPADGRTHVLRRGGAVINVRIENLAGRINPDTASPALLAGLFEAVGTAPAQARKLARAVIAWRSPAVSDAVRAARMARYRQAGLDYGPPGRPFANLAALGAVIGMTPDLLGKCLPHMSLAWTGGPEPAVADPVVRRALALAGETARNGDGLAMPVVEVDARVRGPGAVDVARRAVARVPGDAALVPFRIFSLEQYPDMPARVIRPVRMKLRAR